MHRASITELEEDFEMEHEPINIKGAILIITAIMILYIIIYIRIS
jgi:hypothetical protein